MIPIFSAQRQFEKIGGEILTVITRVLEKGIYILGPQVEKFEQEFAKYLQVKYAIAVASGTDALTLALLACGIGKDDEVILPANSYPTVFAVTVIGAIPKLVDIDPITFNIDPDKISQAITKKTRAIIPVHLYGQPADMERILAIGKRHNIPVIEDCAQAHGAEVRIKNKKRGNAGEEIEGVKDTSGVTRRDVLSSTSRRGSPDGGGIWGKVGSMGDIGCFSFYPTKNLGCFGDGGMVVTNNEEIYRKVKRLRMYGEDRRYHSVMLGRNSRLDEIQAAILLVKLKYLDKWNQQRRKIADLYFSLLNYPFLCSPKEMGRKKGLPSEGFLISLNSGARGEPSPIPPSGTESPHLHHSLREITENTSRANIIQLPSEDLYSKHIYHLFVIRCERRDELKAYLEEKGIQTAIHYPSPIHLQPSFAYLGYRKGDFPQSETASEEILSLPVFPELTEAEIKKVVKEIISFYKL